MHDRRAGDRLVLRSPVARISGWVWMVFAALNFLDIAIRGRTLDSAVAASVLLLGCGIAYVVGLRPRVIADEEAVRLHNPFRDVRVPWPAVRKIEAADTLLIHHTSGTARAWALQTSPRARARADRRARRDAAALPADVAEAAADRSPLDYAAGQMADLQKRAQRGKPSDARPSASWSPIALAALAVPTALLVAMVAMAIAT